MIEFPAQTTVVVLDVHDDFWNLIKELVDEHFPLRDEYWSFLDLFERHSNGWHMELDQTMIDDLGGYWEEDDPDNEQLKHQLLNYEYVLERTADQYDEQITVVLWALQQKGLVAPLITKYLIDVWW